MLVEKAGRDDEEDVRAAVAGRRIEEVVGPEVNGVETRIRRAEAAGRSDMLMVWMSRPGPRQRDGLTLRFTKLFWRV